MNKKYALALLAIVIIAGLFYFFFINKPIINEPIVNEPIVNEPTNNSNLPPQNTNTQNPSADSNYNNNEYGFTLTMPESWKDYSIVKEVWNGELLVAPNTKYQGPKIIIRNPNWTEAKHYQDIPVMVFTPAEWKLIVEENLGVSAAPIGPSKLGENDKYVFALPPRWLGFTDDMGQDQAAEIVKTFKAY